MDRSAGQQLEQLDVEVKVLTTYLVALQHPDLLQLSEIFLGGLALRDPRVDQKLAFGIGLAMAVSGSIFIFPPSERSRLAVSPSPSPGS